MDELIVFSPSRAVSWPMIAALSRPPSRKLFLVVLFGGFLGACDAVSTRPSSDDTPVQCELSSNQLADRATGRDAIPALTNPPLVGPDAETASYLTDSDRVIGLLFGDTPLAVSHTILWQHEIVNFDDWTDRPFAVTFCPLTGSSLAFDREAVNGAEFGVSGLLLHENLIMYDRRENESLWPQMSRRARCGPETGTALSMLPVIEMRWEWWRRLHPDTKVLSSNADPDRTYAIHNHSEANPPSSASSSDDTTPRERVLGLPNGQGLAFPFEILDNGAALRVVREHYRGSSIVVFWHRAARSAMAFQPRIEGQQLSFSVQNGRIVDDETGSTWTVDGRAVKGPKAGARLAPIITAHTAYRRAWTAFHPKTRFWTNPS